MISFMISLNKTIQNVIDDDYMIDFIMFFVVCLHIFFRGNLSYETGRNNLGGLPGFDAAVRPMK